MATYRRETRIRAPFEEVWSFHSTTDGASLQRTRIALVETATTATASPTAGGVRASRASSTRGLRRRPASRFRNGSAFGTGALFGPETGPDRFGGDCGLSFQ